MQWFLYLVGVLWIAFGCWAVLYTDETRGMAAAVRKADARLLAAGPVVLGLLLIVAGSATSHPWFVRLLGLLGVGKGVFIYINPGGRWQKWSDAVIETVSDQAYRLTGIVAIIFGTALFSWIR